MSHSWSNSPLASPARQRGPWTVFHVAETGSTNDDLLAAAAATGDGGLPHGTVLVTDHQTAGRGRLGRRWDAPPGTNLLASILFRRGFDPAQPHELTRRVAVAAAEAIDALTAARSVARSPGGLHAARSAVLKWPNDVLLVTTSPTGERRRDRGQADKVAGILAQAGAAPAGAAASTGPAGVDHVVAGMGCNIGWAPPGAARVEGVTRDELLDAWLDRLAARFDMPIDDAYRAKLVTLGQRVRVERHGDDLGGDLVGLAVDVTHYGELVIAAEPSGERHIINVGDVVHLRPLQ